MAGSRVASINRRQPTSMASAFRFTYRSALSRLAPPIQQLDRPRLGRRKQAEQPLVHVKCAQDANETFHLGGLAGFDALQRALGDACFLRERCLRLVASQPRRADAGPQFLKECVICNESFHKSGIAICGD